MKIEESNDRLCISPEKLCDKGVLTKHIGGLQGELDLVIDNVLNQIQEEQLLSRLEEIWEEGEAEALDHVIHICVGDLHHRLGQIGWLHAEQIEEAGVILGERRREEKK